MVIEPVNLFKYLGVWVDNRLRFNIHLDACIRNASHKIFMLQKIRSCLDQRSANIIYKTMILPFLEYGNCFLLGCTVMEETKSQRVQKKGLKCVFNRDRLYNTKLLHKDVKLVSWEVRAFIAVLCLNKGINLYLVT